MIWTQPEFMPGATRLSSLNESSPFSCCHSRPDFGSKAMPKLLRMPYEKIFWTFSPTSPPIVRPTRQNGLSRGASPSSSRRTITR